MGRIAMLAHEVERESRGRVLGDFDFDGVSVEEEDDTPPQCHRVQRRDRDEEDLQKIGGGILGLHVVHVVRG